MSKEEGQQKELFGEKFCPNRFCGNYGNEVWTHNRYCVFCGEELKPINIWTPKGLMKVRGFAERMD